MKKSIIAYISIIALTSQIILAGSVTKVNEQYGDRGLYETYSLQGKHERCNIVILHGDKIVSTSCLKLSNSKKQKILCTKRKSICKTYKELFYFSENGHLPRATKKNTPKKRSKNKSTKKLKGEYLSYIKKECKRFGAPYCYLVGRYTLFQRECRKGDSVSCGNIRDIDEAIRTNDLQSVHSFSEYSRTGKGK